MTNPVLAVATKTGSRLYRHPVSGIEVPSVSTALSSLDKPALPRWAAIEVARYAVEHKDSWENLPPNDAVELLKKAPWSKSKNAADAGTDAHAYCEARLLGKVAQIPEQTMFSPLHGNAFKNVDGILNSLTDMQVVAVEATAWSNAHGYAGTFDALCVIDGLLTLVDLKTSKDVYADYALQLAAYRFADSILFPDGTEIPMPEIQRCQIWHAPKEGSWKIVDIRADYDEFQAFLSALAIWKWKNDHAPTVIPKTPRKTKKTTEGKK